MRKRNSPARKEIKRTHDQLRSTGKPVAQIKIGKQQYLQARSTAKLVAKKRQNWNLKLTTEFKYSPRNWVTGEKKTFAENLFVIWSMYLESHPRKNALIQDWQPQNSYDPCIEESANMIRQMGNTEYFELCETSWKVQCTQCLKYWASGFVNRTCGECLQHSEQTRRLNQERFDNLSFPNCIIQKWYFRSARRGNSEMQQKYYQAQESLRNAKKHKFISILYMFQESETYRASQLEHRDEEYCKELDQLALENHSYMATPKERQRRESTWVSTLNTQGAVAQKRQRADNSDAKKRSQELRTQQRERERERRARGGFSK